MSLLYDPQLEGELDANGGERLRRIDAGAFQGVGTGIETGLENAGTSLSRIAANVGNVQMRVSGAEMLAGAALTGSDDAENAGATMATAPAPTESQLPQYKAFDSEQVGTVGTILGGLAQQTPSLVAMTFNPVAGAVLAAAQGQTEAKAEGARLGLTGSDLEDYGGVGGLTAGIGAAIPGFAGFGRGAMLYGSRFLLGGTANTVTGELDRWGRAAILDDAGFHDQARQMRQSDAASRVTEFVLGGAFGLLGGRARGDEPAPAVRDDSPEPVTAPLNDAGTPAQEVPTARTPALNDQPSSDAYTSSLEGKASQLMSRGDRKVWQSEAANSQRIIDNLTQQRNDITSVEPKGSGKALSQARQQRASQLADIDRQIAEAQARLKDATDTLAPHMPGGELYEAKAELSRIQQRQREQQITYGSIHEDAATAHVLHDNYVTESAPGLATDGISETAHVRAMDSAGDSVQAGRAVDVSDHIDDNSIFLARGDIDAGTQARTEIAGDASQRIDRVAQAADSQAIPAPVKGEPRPGAISDVVDNPFAALREQATALRETHPDLADKLDAHLNEIEATHTTSTQEAQLYDVAAACALNYGN
ncbi:hypothetical protein [Pantoea cypripedii]|uniref:Uncharacterized protein n=1 Tax=Pantoea cypripedii TaxID=55209 RepID=A0A6B9FZM1_PANCY|nr:hypothetical protein [Pantoea cypripedii]QGY29762.1 hypothetical protein CUN67_12815 [Pantoea cypripedii]